MKITKFSLSVLFIFLVVNVAQGQNQITVTKSYDKFKDLTSLSMRVGMFSTRGGAASWMLQTEYKGQTAPATPKIFLMLISVSDEWKFLRTDLTLRTLVDSKRGSLGKMARASSGVRGGNANEILSLVVSLATIETLSKSNTLEMQVGQDEFTFDKKQIENFKIFVDTVKTEIPKQKTKPKS